MNENQNIEYKQSWHEEYLAKMGLSERQVKAVLYMKEKGKITNQKFQELFSVSKPTATRDLTDLVEKWKILDKEGITGLGHFIC